MIYTGIDLVEIERFSALKPEIKSRFFTRVFTPSEREYIGALESRAAGIFSAKEAVAKALGCGIGPISWQEIEISHTREKQPQVTLLGSAAVLAADLQIDTWSVSITHTKKTAAAVAIAAAK